MTDAEARIFNHLDREFAFDGNDVGLPDSFQPGDMDFFLETSRGDDGSEADELIRNLQEGESDEKESRAKPVLQTTTSRAKPIPVPQSSSSMSNATILPQSLASSQGSSASAFLSGMLNPQPPLSHTPPTMASSYEASHFGKRARAGSVSGRLRSASEFLEQRGLLDRNTKAILKDLIIIGDGELQRAIDSYEMGDPSLLEEMIQSGALQKRLPKDIDLMGDLDFDFLTMNDDDEDIHTHVEILEPAKVTSTSQDTVQVTGTEYPMPGTVTPSYDGIGDLEFSGDLMSDQGNIMPFQSYDSKHTSAATSPGEESNLSDYEQRMRSNSLFSALLNDSHPQNPDSMDASTPEAQYSKWMDRQKLSSKPAKKCSKVPSEEGVGGIGASLEAERKRQEKEAKKLQRLKAKTERKAKKEKKEAEEEKEEHVPGSGRPRSLSDPNLNTSLDADGLQQVERPDGWVGAYSPDSRKVRIERFMEKRNHRVWTKTVKYDVRKNFANSRLRVKGRFVKKEDEVLMRELMSLT